MLIASTLFYIRTFAIIIFNMKSTLIALLLAASIVSAIPLQATPSSSLKGRQSGCENSASDRGCWGDYSIDTDHYTVIPNTGVTRGMRNLVSSKFVAHIPQNFGSQLKILRWHQMDTNVQS